MSWARLLSFSYFVLAAPPKRKADPKEQSLSSVVKMRAAEFDRVASLPAAEQQYRQHQSLKGDYGEMLQRQVSAKLIEGDVRGAVGLMSSENGIAPPTDETFALLKDKH